MWLAGDYFKAGVTGFIISDKLDELHQLILKEDPDSGSKEYSEVCVCVQ